MGSWVNGPPFIDAKRADEHEPEKWMSIVGMIHDVDVCIARATYAQNIVLTSQYTSLINSLIVFHTSTTSFRPLHRRLYPNVLAAQVVVTLNPPSQVKSPTGS